MTRQSLDALLLVLLGVFLASPSLAARSGSWPTCEIAKYEATQRMLACRLDKFAASERTGRSADYTRCTRRFERQLARVKSGFGSDCITADTSEALLASAEVQEADLKASLGDASTPRARKCVAKKAKIQASVLRCHRKQDRKLDRGRKTNYARCEDKARSRLARAESRFDGSCPVGDSHAGVVSAVFAGQTNLYAVAAGIEGKPFCSRSLVTTDLIKRYVTDYTSTTSQNFLASQIWGEVLFGASGLLSRAGGLSQTQIKKLNSIRGNKKDNKPFASGATWPDGVEAKNATSGNATLGIQSTALLSQVSAFNAIAKYCTADPAEIEEYLVTDYHDFDFQSDPQPFMAALMQDLVSGESVPAAETYKFPEGITSSLSLSDQKILKTFANAGPLGAYATMVSPASKSIGTGPNATCIRQPGFPGTCSNDPPNAVHDCKTPKDCQPLKDGLHGASGNGWGLHMYLYASADAWQAYNWAKQHGQNGPDGNTIFQMFWNASLSNANDPCYGPSSSLSSPSPDPERSNKCAPGPTPSDTCSTQPGWRVASHPSTGDPLFEVFHYWSDAGMRFSLFEGVSGGDAKPSEDAGITLMSWFDKDQDQGTPLEVVVKYDATSEDEKYPQEDFIDVREKFPGFLKEVLANKKGTYTPSDGFWQGIVVDLGGTGSAHSCIDAGQLNAPAPPYLGTAWTGGFSAVIPLAGGISADEFAKKLQVAAREGQSNPKARRDRRRLARGSMSPAGEAWTTRATEAAATPAACSTAKGYVYGPEIAEWVANKASVQTTYSPYGKPSNPFVYHFGDPVKDPHKIWATIRSLFKKRVKVLLGVYAETFANRSTIEVGGHTFTNHPKITAGPGNLFVSTVKIDGVVKDEWTTKQFVLADIMRQLANEWIENVWVSGPSWLERESSAITPTAGEKTPKELPFWLGGGCNHPPAKATKSAPTTPPCSLLAPAPKPYKIGSMPLFGGAAYAPEGALFLHANNNQRSDGQKPLGVPAHGITAPPGWAKEAAFVGPYLEPHETSSSVLASQFWPCAPPGDEKLASCLTGSVYSSSGSCDTKLCEVTDRKGVIALPKDLYEGLAPLVEVALYVSIVEAIVKMAPEVKGLEDAVNAHKNLLYLAKIPKFQTMQLDYQLKPAGKSWLPPVGPVVGYTGCLDSPTWPPCGAQPAQMKRLAVKYDVPTCSSAKPAWACPQLLPGCKLDGMDLNGGAAAGGWACAPFLAGLGGAAGAWGPPAPLTSLELLGVYLTPNPRDDGFAKHPPQVTKNYSKCMCPYAPPNFVPGPPKPGQADLSCRGLGITGTGPSGSMVEKCVPIEIKYDDKTDAAPAVWSASTKVCTSSPTAPFYHECTTQGICADGLRKNKKCTVPLKGAGPSSSCGQVQCAGCDHGNERLALSFSEVAGRVQTLLGCQMGSDFICADPKNSPDPGPNDLFLSDPMLAEVIAPTSAGKCFFNGYCMNKGDVVYNLPTKTTGTTKVFCTIASSKAEPHACDGYTQSSQGTKLTNGVCVVQAGPTGGKASAGWKPGPCLPSPSVTTGPGV